ncbi:thioredoxin family protein [Treponema sp. J25]|jgi:small redox-active disulfide protein 2|uniref:thioredoxin family protein n=1 Tax=Treponema sp. J25 TaxID=2094121 RepID=UPI001053D961|nr:thioredoxin family protein [Treponema sp. J25]TCW61838.1 thioredoxin family protein [Treponema sp. J25]HOM24218.1 thioredoxin family protein [Termitinemataceae bacterium]
MKIQILGSGCPKCKQLEENARRAVAQLGITADFEKVSNIDDIMNMGVMMTPALAIDGKVKEMGKVLSPESIMQIIQNHQ